MTPRGYSPNSPVQLALTIPLYTRGSVGSGITNVRAVLHEKGSNAEMLGVTVEIKNMHVYIVKGHSPPGVFTKTMIGHTVHEISTFYRNRLRRLAG
eukprot:m.263693 g.263693  ORF g.263693 m.263693 type:complete len:96 (-) comp51606_c0_seq1:358-645(-)